ncbi:MAG: stage II sporulation protein R [Firmicutes bacterium]|nr:stage II sporulation protein R [Bacillota bacterium]
MRKFSGFTWRKAIGCGLFLIGLCGCIGYACLSQDTVLFRHGEAGDKPLRLHVLADSDSLYDQQVKLAAKDFVVDYLSDALSGAGSKEEAMRTLEGMLPQLTAACNDFVGRQAGYSVGISLVKDDFPQIDYDGLVLAAGEYDALRVVLGSGHGHNWWCVLFPPLCFVDVAGEYDPQAVAAVAAMDDGAGSRLVTVKWKLWQLWNGRRAG